MMKIKNPHILNYWDINKLYGWARSQKFPNFGLEWDEDTSKLTEDFIKNYDEKSEIGYIFEVDIKYLEKLPERKRFEKVEKLITNIHDKTK